MLILDVNDERGVLTLWIKGKAEVECCPETGERDVGNVYMGYLLEYYSYKCGNGFYGRGNRP